MSKYTTELRYICQAYSESSDIKTIIAEARDKIFDFDYPIFDENYKSVLETKIIKHFYTREIGCETVGLWKLWLDERMNLIMPYYNKLYESELLNISPLSNWGYNKTHTENGGTVTTSTNTSEREINENGNENVTTETSGENEMAVSRGSTLQTNDISVTQGSEDSVNKFSDTPQGALTGVLEGTYLTTATADNIARKQSSTQERKDVNTEQVGTTEKNKRNDNNIRNTDSNLKESSNGNIENNFTTTLGYVESVSGKSGVSDSKLLLEFRDTFLNIDEKIINELNDLFMLLW